MKTFEQYIEEAVDFRLGGKDNKGETLFKTFTELSNGDIFYMYTINNETEEIAERKYYFLSITANGNDELDTLIEYKSSPSQASVSHTYAPRLMRNEDCSIFIKSFNDWECSYLYSTTKLDEERVRELWKVYQKESIKRNKNIMVCESVDFRLGGKANKGVVSKTFSELEKGDIFYRYIYNKEENEVEDETERYFIQASEYEADGATKTRIEYNYFIDNGRKMTSTNQILNIYRGEDCSVFIKVYRGGVNCYIYSTSRLSEEELQRIWREHSKEALSYNAKYVICESVDFRLGGSANKGNLFKFGSRGIRFSELKENKDKIYFYYFNTNKNAYLGSNDLTLTTILPLEKDGIARLYNYDAAFSMDMPLEVFEESSLFAWPEVSGSMTVVTTYSVTDKADIDELYEEGKRAVDFNNRMKK